MATEQPTWEFEAADPEVGFLSDTVTHTCEPNLDVYGSPAEIKGVARWALPDGKTVREQTVFECPACGATTTSVDDFPAWMFEEPR